MNISEARILALVVESKAVEATLVALQVEDRNTGGGMLKKPFQDLADWQSRISQDILRIVQEGWL